MKTTRLSLNAWWSLPFIRMPFKRNGALGGFFDARSQPQKKLLPAAFQSGQADDLALPDPDAAILKSAAASDRGNRIHDQNRISRGNRQQDRRRRRGSKNHFQKGSGGKRAASCSRIPFRGAAR